MKENEELKEANLKREAEVERLKIRISEIEEQMEKIQKKNNFMEDVANQN